MVSQNLIFFQMIKLFTKFFKIWDFLLEYEIILGSLHMNCWMILLCSVKDLLKLIAFVVVSCSCFS